VSTDSGQGLMADPKPTEAMLLLYDRGRRQQQLGNEITCPPRTYPIVSKFSFSLDHLKGMILLALTNDLVHEV
jgi:hypothetical protein